MLSVLYPPPVARKMYFTDMKLEKTAEFGHVLRTKYNLLEQELPSALLILSSLSAMASPDQVTTALLFIPKTLFLTGPMTP